MKITVDIPNCFINGEDSFISIENESFSYSRFNHLPYQRKDEESVSFRVVEKEHISTVQDCKLAVEVTEKKAIEAAKQTIADIFYEVHGINQTMYLEDFVARLKK